MVSWSATALTGGASGWRRVWIAGTAATACRSEDIRAAATLSVGWASTHFKNALCIRVAALAGLASAPSQNPNPLMEGIVVPLLVPPTSAWGRQAPIAPPRTTLPASGGRASRAPPHADRESRVG